jgi:phosphopantetheinyl transferase (holo-ACP synthase)
LELIDLWREFAGHIPAKLSLIENTESQDISLQKDLAAAKIKYADLDKFKPYFSEEPTAPKRKLQWARSRRCLLDVLESLPSSKDTWVSLSHTDTESLVIGCNDTLGSVTGIGVDMERAERLIEPGAVDKFTLPSETGLSLNPLCIWTIKEACYKADTARSGSVVSQYEIKNFDKSSGEGYVSVKNLTPFIRFKFILFNDFAITFAIGDRRLYASDSNFRR